MRYITAVGICMAMLVFLPGASAQKAPVAVDNRSFIDQSAPQWQFLNTYSVTYNNSKLKTERISFDAMKPEYVPEKAEVFEKVVRKLRGRMMPPPGQSRPSEEKYDAFIGWLEGYL